MDIQITVRTGQKTVNDDGSAHWDSSKVSTLLVTYSKSKESAIEEALSQLRKQLVKDLITG